MRWRNIQLAASLTLGCPWGGIARAPSATEKTARASGVDLIGSTPASNIGPSSPPPPPPPLPLITFRRQNFLTAGCGKLARENFNSRACGLQKSVKVLTLRNFLLTNEPTSCNLITNNLPELARDTRRNGDI